MRRNIKNNRHLASTGSTRGALISRVVTSEEGERKEHHRHHHHHHRHQHQSSSKNFQPPNHVDLNDMSLAVPQTIAKPYPSSFVPPNQQQQQPLKNRNHNLIHGDNVEEEDWKRRQPFAPSSNQLQQQQQQQQLMTTSDPKLQQVSPDKQRHQSSSLFGINHLQSGSMGDDIVVDNDEDEEVRRKNDIAAFSSKAVYEYGSMAPQQQQPQLHPLRRQAPPQSSFETQNQQPPSFPQQQQQQQQPRSKHTMIPTMVDQSHDQQKQTHDVDRDATTVRDAIVDGLLSFWHTLVFDPKNPEFSSLHQFTWAVFLGVFMGILTALWGILIDHCVELVWIHIPALLLKWGIFTDLDGHFPLPHYMWICPSIFGGVLSYLSAVLPPIPDQNVWIETLHRVGIVEHTTFLQLILISTAGMASGLSLGPELPLVISAGMVGSYIGLKTRQSILSARVMNLTAASAAIGGFFGFPMAGALFVLELPHRMGLQYFEALSPATIASIIAVLVNRIITQDDVKGMFTYPFLSSTLPSSIFYIAIIYGLAGSLAGTIYTVSVLKLKGWVHDWFHYHHHHHGHHHGQDANNHKSSLSDVKGKGETLPLVGNANAKMVLPARKSNAYSWNEVKQKFMIKEEPKRAACAGVLAGAIVGLCCMFFPHLLFWGEAQLQTLIDSGETPLPFLQEEDSPTANITAYGYCLIDSKDEVSIMEGFSISCTGILFIGKIVVIGLSLGTGIIGGQFWGPLFVGCIFAQLFTDILEILPPSFSLKQLHFPCVAILCIMGATHVVTFRAHMAIMLILTLTISSFAPSSKLGAALGGDYSAIFPLLVVSCFVSLMLTRSIVFYKKQCSRGDIIASPEVLCEPRKEGTPNFPIHQDAFSYSDNSYSSSSSSSSQIDDDGDSSSTTSDDNSYPTPRNNPYQQKLSQTDIERNFALQQQHYASMNANNNNNNVYSNSSNSDIQENNSGNDSSDAPAPKDRLDELLSQPMEAKTPPMKSRRRIKSDLPDLRLLTQPPVTSMQSQLRHVRHSSIRGNEFLVPINQPPRDRLSSTGSESGGRLSQVSSYGEIREPQPDLMSQGRQRASSVTKSPMLNPKKRPPRGRHSRSSSKGSFGGSDLENSLSMHSLSDIASSSNL